MSVINKIGQFLKEPVEDKYIFFAGLLLCQKSVWKEIYIHG